MSVDNKGLLLQILPHLDGKRRSVVEVRRSCAVSEVFNLICSTVSRCYVAPVQFGLEEDL